VRGSDVRFTPKGDGGCVGGSKQNGIKPLRVPASSATSEVLAMSPPRKARMMTSDKAPARAPGLPSFADTHVLRGILDAMPARVSYFDAGRNYRYNNKEFYDFMGLKPDQVLGRNVAEVLGQQPSDETLLQVEAVRRGETTRTEGWREYKSQGRPDDAVRAFEALREADPGYVPMYLMAGTLLLDGGRKDDARGWLEAGVEAAKRAGDSKALGEIGDALARC
jgi:PAS domain-containing protein